MASSSRRSRLPREKSLAGVELERVIGNSYIGVGADDIGERSPLARAPSKRYSAKAPVVGDDDDDGDLSPGAPLVKRDIILSAPARDWTVSRLPEDKGPR